MTFSSIVVIDARENVVELLSRDETSKENRREVVAAAEIHVSTPTILALYLEDQSIWSHSCLLLSNSRHQELIDHVHKEISQELAKHSEKIRGEETILFQSHE